MPRKVRGLPHYTPEFEAFWKAYPRRRPNPKPEAGDAFFLVLELKDPRATAETLVAAAERFAAECRREKVDPVFIPHARTWLNKRRFLDYLAPTEGDAPTVASPSAALSPSDGSTMSPSGEDPRAHLGGDARLHPLAAHMTRIEYDAWIAPLEVGVQVSQVGPAPGAETPRIIAPSPTHRDWVRNHYGDLLRRALGAGISYGVRPYRGGAEPCSPAEARR